MIVRSSLYTFSVCCDMLLAALHVQFCSMSFAAVPCYSLQNVLLQFACQAVICFLWGPAGMSRFSGCWAGRADHFAQDAAR